MMVPMQTVFHYTEVTTQNATSGRKESNWIPANDAADAERIAGHFNEWKNEPQYAHILGARAVVVDMNRQEVA